MFGCFIDQQKCQKKFDIAEMWTWLRWKTSTFKHVILHHWIFMTFWVKSIYAILICQEISQDHGSPKKKKSFGWRELSQGHMFDN